MGQPEPNRRLKIRLHNQGEDAETVWAEDLGITLLNSTARYVRIENVPFLHLKPTFGDVIEVLPDADGMFEWDRDGLEFDTIGTRILQDGGRWLAVIRYWPPRKTLDRYAAFLALRAAGDARDIVVEGAYATKTRGIACLAVPESMDLIDLLFWLLSLYDGVRSLLLHPKVVST